MYMYCINWLNNLMIGFRYGFWLPQFAALSRSHVDKHHDGNPSKVIPYRAQLDKAFLIEPWNKYYLMVILRSNFCP